MAGGRRRRARRQRRRRNMVILGRRIPDRSNPLEDLSEEKIFSRFRFRTETIVYIMHLLNLGRETRRSNALPPLIQLLSALRFLATGGFCSLVADSFAVLSTSSVHRSVTEVCGQLAAMARQFVYMPTGLLADDMKKLFYKVAGFPNVLGCVDGTFIRILAPKVREGEFINRKGFHSLNVQMVCDAKYRILNCVAKWPGSVHDSRIFRDSNLCIAFENGIHHGFLLGDSGYPCKSFLLTPYLDPSTNSQMRYNRSHARTRVLIEQTFGILKRRFNCLHDGLRATPTRTCTIVLACAVLHNIGIDHNDIIDNVYDTEGTDDVQMHLRDDWNGTSVRDYLCQAFFQ